MYQIRTRCALALSLFLFGHSAAARAGEAMANPGCDNGHDFGATVERYAALLRLPGYALAVARNGKIEYQRTQGYADLERRRPVRADSIFPVASITKTFTVALMMQYVEEGRIRLDDHLADYPQFDDAHAWPYSSADIRIRHVLSQTSEGAKPGEVFTYNGNRFNQVYGVFVKTSGQKDYARAFAEQIKTRILDRIGLQDTLTAFPDATNDAHAARIVTPYRYDRVRAAFVADDDLRAGHRNAYPNSGMLSTLADMARYLNALDRGSLISKASVTEMTAPFKLNDRSDSPYGLGWFSEEWRGTRLSWVYGLGPSYSSFVLHVPSERLSLIFFANNDGPTAALRLNYGNVLQFPLAAGFLHCFAGKSFSEIGADADIGELEARLERMPAAERRAAFAQAVGVALTWRYAEKLHGAAAGKAMSMVHMLYRVDPGYFRELHPELIGLIADLSAPALAKPMNDLAAAYAAREQIDPRISQDLGDFYDRIGDRTASMRHRMTLVTAPGYETNDATIFSAFALGDQYFSGGDIAAGRKYYWIGIRDAVGAGWGSGFAEEKRRRMIALSNSANGNQD